MKKLIIVLLFPLLVGCSEAQRMATIGGITGGILGGVTGHQGGERDKGIVIGAVSGAAMGYAYGNEEDKESLRTGSTTQPPPMPRYHNRGDHYELQKVWVPGKERRTWVPPKYETRYDPDGTPYNALVQPGHYVITRGKGHYEVRMSEPRR